MVLSKISLKWKYVFPILLLLPFFVYSLHYEDEWDGVDRQNRIWCNLLKECQPQNRTVCGWDKDASFLAQFENICILYRANCRGAGKFNEVEMIICDTQKNYSLTHPDGSEEFEWIHIEHGTSAASTVATPTIYPNKTGLRQKSFETLYPEGGTLPSDFFDVETKTPLRVLNKTTTVKGPGDAELRARMLELLWRRSAGRMAGSPQENS